MLREGPIPAAVHGLIEYGAGLLLIAAPFLFSFEEPLAVGTSVVLGVILLILAAATEGPAGIVSQIPVPVHVVLDYVVVAILIAAPFVLGFSDEAAPRNLFLVLGVAHLLISIGTRFRPPAGAGGKSAAPARPPRT